MERQHHDLMRRQMVAEVVADAVFLTAQLGKSSFAPKVIEAMGKIPRHEFVPLELQSYAYINSPLPVGYRSEEHTSELQSLRHLVCRLLLETKKHTSELQSLRHLVCRLLLERKKMTPMRSFRDCRSCPTLVPMI